MAAKEEQQMYWESFQVVPVLRWYITTAVFHILRSQVYSSKPDPKSHNDSLLRQHIIDDVLKKEDSKYCNIKCEFNLFSKIMSPFSL